MSLCGKNIRCGDCDEFTWAPHVCEPLRKMEKMNVSYFLELHSAIDKKYKMEVHDLKMRFVKANARYKVGQCIVYRGTKNPIISVQYDALYVGAWPRVSYVVQLHTKAGKPRVDGAELEIPEHLVTEVI